MKTSIALVLVGLLLLAAVVAMEIGWVIALELLMALAGVTAVYLGLTRDAD